MTEPYIIQGVLPEALQISGEQYAWLWNQHPEIKPTINIYGKSVQTPRWFKSYGKDYKFSGQIAQADPIPEYFQCYVDYFTQVYGQGNKFNQILINWYQDSATDYISWHPDDEKQLIPNSSVVTISFGVTRPFSIRPKDNTKNTTEYMMPHNSVLIMGGSFQQDYQHAVLKRAHSKIAPINFIDPLLVQ